MTMRIPRPGMLQMSLLACSLLCFAMLTGCGGGDGGEPGDTAASLTAQGWELYEDGDYEGAIGKFDAATDLDANYSDAYNGLGWSYAKLDSLSKALTNFNLCVSKGDDRPDPSAGKAPVLRDLDPPQFQNAIDAAIAALTKDSDFEFEHYEDFDWHDLRLIKAQCYYALNMYPQAVAEIVALGGSVDDPNSADEIATKIEDLGDLYGG
jgi:tetratricopeptide (TPR) repeat protein